MSPKVTWIGIVVALLTMSLVLHGVLLAFAIGDPSFAVEPDYERKAAHWDEIRAERARSEALGWTVELRTTPAVTPYDVDVVLSALDATGHPIEGAEVTVETFHNARAGHPLRRRLEPEAPGRYAAIMPLRRPGIWEFRLRIERGDDRYVDHIRKSVVVGPRRDGSTP